MFGLVVVEHLRSLVGCNPYGAVLRRQPVEGTTVRKLSNLIYICGK
jgi:hypothetical protein